MSVYKDPRSPFYQYSFKLSGRRFSGSTKTGNRKAAEQVERDVKAKAKADIEQEKRIGSGPLLIRHAAGRYWREVGKHLANDKDCWRDLDRLVAYFTPDKRLDEITNSDVAALVAWRRAQTIKPQKKGKSKGKGKSNDAKLEKPISPATVNRTVLAPLRAVFIRAREVWGYTFKSEPKWSTHWLEEPEEIVRELNEHQADALDDNVRDDYSDWFEFARITGRRRNASLILWEHVKDTQIISPKGKRGKKAVTPITDEIRAILDRCRGHHPTHVFTYICKRPLRPGQKKGKRYPITPSGAKMQWRRLRVRSGVNDFRFHDLRHDLGTKTLRRTGNIKLVAKLLNHSNISTASKYAHVLDDDVRDAISSFAKDRKKDRNASNEKKQATETQ